MWCWFERRSGRVAIDPPRRRAGRARRTIHDARKTLTAAVVSMATLGKWAGHSKIETTATYYCRERESDADKLGDAMRDDAADLWLVG